VHSISLKKVTLLGFTGPIVIMAGALASVAIGRGEAVMLPSTVAALAFYGVVIALGAAWRDGAPGFFSWMPRVRATNARPGLYLIRSTLLLVAVFSAGTIALGLIVWLAASAGTSDLVWRPVLAIALCLWLGIDLASVVAPRVST
jgi:hypothetical protein